MKSVKIAPVIIGATGMIQKNLTEILNTIPRNITANQLQLEGSPGFGNDPEKSPRNKTLRTTKLNSLVHDL